MSATQTPMTDQQATDEALLLLTRKLNRLHHGAYADVLAMLPAGARRALALAEARADVHRDRNGGASGLAYPSDEIDGE